MELCDVVYVIRLDFLERHVAQQQLRAALLGQQVPSFAERRVEFDAWLEAPPQEIPEADRETAELRMALGIGGVSG